MHKQDLKRTEDDREKTRTFVEGYQQRAQSQYEKLEVEFRHRSDEVPKQLVNQQELTRVMRASTYKKKQFLTRSSYC